MNYWHPSVKEYLENKDYEKVINFYENLVENNPNEISNYWYLGLAYLLAKDTDSAQTTWFLVFSQGNEEEIEKWTQELINILDEEAIKQLELSRYEQSLLIRENINQISPDNINNLLHIVNLEILLKEFKTENLDSYNLIFLVRNSQPDTLNLLLLSTILQDILLYPHTLNILFAEAILTYTHGNAEIIKKISNIATVMGTEKQYTLYGIHLLEICNNFSHQQSSIFINLYTFYKMIKNFDKQIQICEQYYHQADNFVDKLSSCNILLSSYLTLAQWNKFLPLAKKQCELYEKIENHIQELSNSDINKDGFIIGIMNFFYLEDKPKYNRILANKIANVFQKVNKPFYPEFSFALPKNKKFLKIGYISHTFNTHAVGYLSRWLIYHHDSSQFDVNLYMTQNHPDDITEKWFKPYVSQIFMGERNVKALVEKIHSDEIDILVDLDSLTLNLTCAVMAVKPAPIQVTWLGLDASGIPNIDYYIADPYVLPDHAQEYYSEKIWRLPHTYVAMDNVEIGNSTLTREDLDIPSQGVVFLNIQNTAKLNPHLVELQMKILSQVKNGYLIFNIRKDETRLKQYIYSLGNKFYDITERVRFLPSFPPEIYRANLAIADIMLDTYPFNGAVTTLDGLWQNIPLITRVGQQFNARQGYTFLTNLGITEGIAWSDEEYVEWGIKLGTDEQLRKEVSWKLRQSKKTSPLWNGKQFTQEMEKAYQQMWEIYLQENQ